jgi:phosphoribosylanthranilate isomerase
MRTRVKICGITRPGDAEAVAMAGADALGFVFWAGTPRRVEPAHARAIAAAVHPFVSIVGLFVDPEPAEVRAVLEVVPLDLLQFHGRESPDLCRSFARPYLKAMPVGAAEEEGRLLESLAPYGDAAGWLLDAPAAHGRPGGTGNTFDWSRVPTTLARPLVLSGGLHAGNVADAIRRLRPWAVDVSSGVEERGEDGRAVPGRKDAQAVRRFIEEVRHADG